MSSPRTFQSVPFGSLKRLFILIGIVAIGPSAAAQPPTELGKSLGLTKDNNALPIWSQIDDQSKTKLGQTARDQKKGVMLVGHPKVGTGTAWVISKKHRLLATNAHVADMLLPHGKMFAIVNESAHVYQIKQVWYHPGVRRLVPGARSLSKLSANPKDGDIFPMCPDLAVLELGEGGPDLPIELPMARPDEIGDLLGQPAAVFGFPGHDTKSWPGAGDEPIATLHGGMVSRVTDFHNGTKRERQQLQYTMATWGGFSGSPVFLPSGRVIAIHNMARTIKNEQTGEIRSIAHGVRIDCLWELLVHHGLQDKVAAKIDESKLDVKRWLQPDERDEVFAQVKRLTVEASTFELKNDPEAAIVKINEAIKLAPDFADLYVRRGAYTADIASRDWKKLSKEEKQRLNEATLRDNEIALKLEPTELWNLLSVLQARTNLASLQRDTAKIEKNLAIYDEILKMSDIPTTRRAFAHSAHGSALFTLSRFDEAIKAWDEASRLCPKEPAYWQNRALAWQELGRKDLEAACLAKVKEIQKQLAAERDKKK
jgi:tetratricopeptide (TPR) repeat protein